MEKESNQSEFCNKVVGFAREMDEMVKAETGGVKHAIIVIGVESPDDSDEASVQIGVCGRGRELVHGIAELATREESRGLVNEALKLALVKKLASMLD